MTKSEMEIWEVTIPGRVSVTVLNDRGNPQTLSALGPYGDRRAGRIRLTTEQRELVEEGNIHPEHNAFRNGMLIQVNAKSTAAAAPDQLSDDDLGNLFSLTGSEFEGAVKVLSEVNVRRLKMLTVPHDAAKSQIDFLDEYIAESWPIGGDTPTYREMSRTP